MTPRNPSKCFARHARSVAAIVAALGAVLCAACASKKVATEESYLSSLDYQSRETLGQSLFREDSLLLSNEDIERILSSKIALPRDARLAVLQLGGDQHVLVLPGPDAGAADALGALTEKLRASTRLSSVALLPSLLAPTQLTVPKLREAAARFQADLLLVYRTPCQQFQRSRLLRPDQAKAYCLAEGVLLDVRTGIFPFSGVGSSAFGAVQNPEDLNSYETFRRSQDQAIFQALEQLAGDLVAFLDSAP